MFNSQFSMILYLNVLNYSKLQCLTHNSATMFNSQFSMILYLNVLNYSKLQCLTHNSA